MPDSQNQTLGQSNVWANNNVGFEFDFTVPSGQTCRLVRKPLETLILEGVIDDIDSLTAIVESQHVGPKSRGRKKPSDRKPSKSDEEASMAARGLAMMKDENFAKSLEIMDKVLIAVVTQPKLSPNPAPGEEADPNKIYVRQVGLSDKTAIFSEVMGGVKSAETFRPESE